MDILQQVENVLKKTSEWLKTDYRYKDNVIYSVNSPFPNNDYLKAIGIYNFSIFVNKYNKNLAISDGDCDIIILYFDIGMETCYISKFTEEYLRRGAV